MECNKALLDSVNKSLHNNMGKAIIALLVVMLCSSLAAPVALSVALMGGTSFFPIIVLVLCVTCVCLLVFGFGFLVAQLYRRRQAVLGHVFSAFRDFKRMGLAALVFALGITIISMVVVLVGMTLFTPDIKLEQTATLDQIIGPLLQIMPVLSAICMVVFIFALVLPNIFVWLVLYDNPTCTVRQAFKKSFDMPKGKRSRLVSFLLRCGGWWFAAACAAFVISTAFLFFVVPNVAALGTTMASFLSFVANICDIVYFFGFYTAFIRMTTGVVAFYDELLHPDKDLNEPPQSIEAPVIELPAPDVEN